MPGPSVVYVLPDKMGGMVNIVSNLLQYRQPDGLSYHVVLTHNHLHEDARFSRPLPCDSQTTVEYTLPVENLYTVMRRVARAIPAGPWLHRRRQTHPGRHDGAWLAEHADLPLRR